MLRDRQQLDVRVAQLLDVGDQLLRQLAVGEEALACLGSRIHEPRCTS